MRGLASRVARRASYEARRGGRRRLLKRRCFYFCNPMALLEEDLETPPDLRLARRPSRATGSHPPRRNPLPGKHQTPGSGLSTAPKLSRDSCAHRGCLHLARPPTRTGTLLVPCVLVAPCSVLAA